MAQYKLTVTSTDTEGLVTETLPRLANSVKNKNGTFTDTWTFNRKDTARRAVNRVRRLQKNRERLNVSYSLEKVEG